MDFGINLDSFGIIVVLFEGIFLRSRHGVPPPSHDPLIPPLTPLSHPLSSPLSSRFLAAAVLKVALDILGSELLIRLGAKMGLQRGQFCGDFWLLGVLF